MTNITIRQLEKDSEMKGKDVNFTQVQRCKWNT